MTLRLPSPAGAVVWTTPTMEKVLKEATPPEEPGDAIQIYAAKNEAEASQVVVRADANATASLAIAPIDGVARVEIQRVGYVNITQPSDAISIKSPSGKIPDPLEPTTFGASESLVGLSA